MFQYDPYQSDSSNFTQRAKAAGKLIAVAALTLLVSAPSIQGFAETTKAEFVPFKDFLDQTRSTRSADLLARPEAAVKQPAAIEEMRAAILERYKGVEVNHSFLLDGQHYDCVRVEQQPAFRTYGLKEAAAAPPKEMLSKNKLGVDGLRSGGIKSAGPASAAAEQFDSFGNPARCSENTVPLLRTTLETMSRFASLEDYYQKVPGDALKASQPKFADPAVAAHKYSYTIENVNNHGGNSNLNVWSPYVYTSLGEIFSLSQEWYVGGSGAGLQTEEVGWVVYPAMFGGSEQSHFFIYSTSGGYASGTGCWNNSCGDFVQVADSGLLGNSFSNYSTLGGAQYEISAEYYLYEGNWWLAYGGTWVGYYPGAKYHGGQNTRYAQSVQYGTESVGTWIWPGEGSGQFSNRGFGYAAYQRNLWYINTANTSYWENVTPENPSPGCYTITGPYTSSGAWTKYFYEGGPGGFGC